MDNIGCQLGYFLNVLSKHIVNDEEELYMTGDMVLLEYIHDNIALQIINDDPTLYPYISKFVYNKENKNFTNSEYIYKKLKGIFCNIGKYTLIAYFIDYVLRSINYEIYTPGPDTIYNDGKCANINSMIDIRINDGDNVVTQVGLNVKENGTNTKKTLWFIDIIYDESFNSQNDICKTPNIITLQKYIELLLENIFTNKKYDEHTKKLLLLLRHIKDGNISNICNINDENLSPIYTYVADTYDKFKNKYKSTNTQLTKELLFDNKENLNEIQKIKETINIGDTIDSSGITFADDNNKDNNFIKQNLKKYKLFAQTNLDKYAEYEESMNLFHNEHTNPISIYTSDSNNSSKINLNCIKANLSDNLQILQEEHIYHASYKIIDVILGICYAINNVFEPITDDITVYRGVGPFAFKNIINPLFAKIGCKLYNNCIASTTADPMILLDFINYNGGCIFKINIKKGSRVFATGNNSKYTTHKENEIILPPNSYLTLTRKGYCRDDDKRVLLLEFDFNNDTEVNNIFNELTQIKKGGSRSSEVKYTHKKTNKYKSGHENKNKRNNTIKKHNKNAKGSKSKKIYVNVLKKTHKKHINKKHMYGGRATLPMNRYGTPNNTEYLHHKTSASGLTANTFRSSRATNATLQNNNSTRSSYSKLATKYIEYNDKKIKEYNGTDNKYTMCPDIYSETKFTATNIFADNAHEYVNILKNINEHTISRSLQNHNLYGNMSEFEKML